MIKNNGTPEIFVFSCIVIYIGKDKLDLVHIVYIIFGFGLNSSIETNVSFYIYDYFLFDVYACPTRDYIVIRYITYKLNRYINDYDICSHRTIKQGNNNLLPTGSEERGAFLLQYYPLVNICKSLQYNFIYTNVVE